MLKLLLLLALLLNLSCDSEDAEAPKSCQEKSLSAACMPAMPDVEWNIIYKRSFPRNVLLKILDRVVLNECQGDFPHVEVSRKDQFTLIDIKRSFLLQTGTVLKVELVDLGDNCLSQKTIYFNPNQPYKIKNEQNEKSVFIEI